MKPSEQVKSAGLKSLKELSDMTEQSPQTLMNWHSDKPKLFEIVILGAVEKKKEMQ